MASPIIPFDIEARKKAAAHLTTEQNTWAVAAANLEVEDDDSYAQAIQLKNAAGSAIKKITEFWEPLCKAANALHKMLTGARAEMVAPFQTISDTVEKKAKKYYLQKKEAERAAEAELLKLAEKQRLEAAKEADRLMGMGRVDESEALRRQSEITTLPALPSNVPKVDNAKTSDTLEPEVTDLLAFLRDIVEGKMALMHEYRGEQRPLVTVDMAVLRDVVKRQGGRFQCAGVTVSEGVKISAKKL